MTIKTIEERIADRLEKAYHQAVMSDTSQRGNIFEFYSADIAKICRKEFGPVDEEMTIYVDRFKGLFRNRFDYIPTYEVADHAGG